MSNNTTSEATIGPPWSPSWVDYWSKVGQGLGGFGAFAFFVWQLAGQPQGPGMWRVLVVAAAGLWLVVVWLVLLLLFLGRLLWEVVKIVWACLPWVGRRRTSIDLESAVVGGSNNGSGGSGGSGGGGDISAVSSPPPAPPSTPPPPSSSPSSSASSPFVSSPSPLPRLHLSPPSPPLPLPLRASSSAGAADDDDDDNGAEEPQY
ncbi:hypothetical protein PG990_003342 [Apiospora arundinis]